MKYLSEVSKSARYEKIHESVEKAIHKIAEAYMDEHGTERVEDNHGKIKVYNITEEKLDDEAYNYACEKFMETIENSLGAEDIYWIFEIILEDSFGYVPSQKNPYAVRKPTLKVALSPFGFPYFKTTEE